MVMVFQISILKKLIIHLKKNKIGLVTAVNPSERYGILKLNKNNRSSKIFQKNHLILLIGLMVVSLFLKKIFKYLSEKRNEMLERKPLMKLTEEKQLYAFKHRGFWKAMDTLRDKVEFEKIWKSGKRIWKSKL